MSSLRKWYTQVSAGRNSPPIHIEPSEALLDQGKCHRRARRILHGLKLTGNYIQGQIRKKKVIHQT